MEINLKSIGMNKGQQYETIITTKDKNDNKNAAPIGVICKGEKNIMCRIFKGSKTLDNIISQKEFIVNINYSPMLFTLATINNIPENYFNDNNSIKDSLAYFKCEVYDLVEAVKKSDPIRKSEAIVVKAKVIDLVINNECKAMNRGFGMLIETLVNYSRIDMIGEEYFTDRFLEAKRVINKVGSKKERECINEIKKELID